MAEDLITAVYLVSSAVDIGAMKHRHADASVRGQFIPVGRSGGHSAGSAGRLWMERLETRTLFSGPAAVLETPPAPIAGSQNYTFTVDYSDSAPIDVKSLGNDNVLVTGPNGYSQLGQFVGEQPPSPSSGGTTPTGTSSGYSGNTGGPATGMPTSGYSTFIPAIYSVYFPGNGLTDALNGAYTVTQIGHDPNSGGGVTDIEGTGFPAATIGTFDVALAPAPQMQLTNPVYTPGNYAIGSPVSFRATVTNAGDATEPFFSLAVGLSPTAKFNNGAIAILGSTTIDQSLAPGQSVTVNVPNAVIPATASVGSYYIGAKINYNLATAANNNNNSNDSFSSANADIIVTPPAPPPPPPVAIGGLNASFGSGGVVREVTGLSNTTAVAAQPDGKTIAVGEVNVFDGSHDFGVSRFNADGSIDTTWGQTTSTGVITPGAGAVVTDFVGDDIPVAVVVQPDGKVLVAGSSTTFGNNSITRFALSRYNSDGSLDTTFGAGGRALTSFMRPPNPSGGTPPPPADGAGALLLMGNGQIVVAGHSNAGGSQDFALARYNADGSLDTSFGNNGQVLTDFQGGVDSANAVAFDPRNGDIVAAGAASSPTTGVTEYALASYRPTGALDVSFGQGGKVLTSIDGQDDEAYGVAVNSQGSIAATGATFTTAAGGTVNSEVATVLYTPAGAPSRQFGAHGIVTTNLAQPGVANQVQFNSNGSILIAGGTIASLGTIDTSNIEVALVQYTATGALDTTFASGKPLILNLGGSASTPLPAPVRSPAGRTGPVNVGGSISAEAQAALTALARQHAIAQALGKLVVIATSGTDTAVAQVVSSGASLTDAVQATVPASVMTGARGAARVTVSNGGNQAAAGTVTITLYASLDQTLDSTDVLLVTAANARIVMKPTASRLFKLKFQFPTSLADGSYYMLADIVPTISGTDLNSSNVAHSNSPVAVAAPRVDLTGPALITPTGLHAGSDATLPVTFKNDGNIPAREAVSVTALAAADLTPASGDATIASTSLKVQLKPGLSGTFTLHLLLPATLPPGTYHLLVLLTGANHTRNILAGADALIVS